MNCELKKWHDKHPNYSRLATFALRVFWVPDKKSAECYYCKHCLDGLIAQLRKLGCDFEAIEIGEKYGEKTEV